MSDPAVLLDRGVPDVVDTDALPPRLAAEIDYLAGRTATWVNPSIEVSAGLRARALVVAGRLPEARRSLVEVAGSGPVDAQDAFAAAWASSRVGGPAIDLATVASSTGPPDDAGHRPGDGFVSIDGVPIGHVAFADGLAAVHQGDLTAAADSFAIAVAAGDRRSPLWGALARVELSRVRWTMVDLLPLGDPGRPAAIDEARRLGLSARTFFVAGGYRHLMSTTAGLFGRVEAEGSGAAAEAGAGAGRGAHGGSHARAEPRLGHLVEGPSWTVGFGAVPPVEVRPSKGLVALRHLLLEPGRAVAAVELDLVIDGEDPVELGHDALLAAVASGEADESELRPRLLDPRARSRTSKLLRRTIERLRDDHPVLAQHLAMTVRTGYACRYDGDPAITWRR